MISMKLNIISDIENVLLGRREIVFSISHPSAGTPTRAEVNRQIAARFNVDLNQVYIVKMISRTGGNSTEGEAQVYSSIERAKLVGRDYLLKRSAPPEEKPVEEKPVEEKPVEEKPVEKKPPSKSE